MCTTSEWSVLQQRVRRWAALTEDERQQARDWAYSQRPVPPTETVIAYGENLQGKRCPVCGNLMREGLTKPPYYSWICTHPHTDAMLEKFLAGSSPPASDTTKSNGGTKGSS